MPGLRLAVCLTALAGCGAPEVSTQDEATETAGGIVRGTTQPTVLALTARQKLAVGALLDRWEGWSNQCTGTLITPTLVATAAHCVEDLRVGDVAFAVGDDAEAPRQSAVAAAIYEHPDYDTYGDAENDFAVLRFTSPFTSADPIAVNCDALPSTLAGKRLQTAGFGETLTDDENTRRYWAAVTVQYVTAYDITTYGAGSGGCYGDSGGPLLASLGGQVRLVGTLSWGDSCGYTDHYARVDSVCAFLRTVPGFSATPAPAPGGSSQTVEGVTFSAAQVTSALALANTATEAKLDVDVGLDSRAARALVAGRPFASLAAVAAAPYVGASALARLRDF